MATVSSFLLRVVATELCFAMLASTDAFGVLRQTNTSTITSRTSSISTMVVRARVDTNDTMVCRCAQSRNRNEALGIGAASFLRRRMLESESNAEFGSETVSERKKI